MKRDKSQFADVQTSTGRQVLSALPNTMKALVICTCSLSSSTHSLVRTSSITPGEVMDVLHMKAEFYGLYDCRVSVVSLMEIYKDHVIAPFTRLCPCGLKIEFELPPKTNFITPELRLALNRLSEATRQRVSRYTIPYQEHCRTG